jgi:hypothetical protein
MITATKTPTCRAILLDLLTRLDGFRRQPIPPSFEDIDLIGFDVLEALKALNAETDGPEPSNAERAWWAAYTRDN